MDKNSSQLIDLFREKRILVIGDLMLDSFISGKIERISPESPVPVLLRHKEEIAPGGAGNVAANLAALGVQVTLGGVVGKDAAGDDVRSLLSHLDIDLAGLIEDESRPTTTKTRFVAQGQQMLRVDDEKTHAVSKEIETRLCDFLNAHSKSADMMILSDYAKGVLTDKIIQTSIESGKPVLVDPKSKDFSKYKGAHFITPNLKELCTAFGQNISEDKDIESAAATLLKKAGIGAMIVTRSEHGLSVIESNNAATHIPAAVRDVYDVSGAGDTVIATLAAALSAGADLKDAAQLANMAAGIAVARQGTSIVSAEDLKSVLYGRAIGSSIAPCLTREEALVQIKDWQAQGFKVGFTNGCFDILHHGHVSYLDRARARCDKLVIGLNHDNSVKILKGETRPVNDQKARASVIGALASVDLVVFFGADQKGEDNTPCALLDSIRPDIILKGGD